MSISGTNNNFNPTIDGLTNFQLSDLNIDSLVVNNNTQISGVSTINGSTTFTGNLILNTTTNTINGNLTFPSQGSITNISGVLEFPVVTGTDTFVCENNSTTLTNKTIDSGVFSGTSIFTDTVRYDTAITIRNGYQITWYDGTNTAYSDINQYANDFVITNRYDSGYILVNGVNGTFPTQLTRVNWTEFGLRTGVPLRLWDNTNTYYTETRQFTTTYMIDTNYNSSTILLRTKDVSGTAVNYSFAYDQVSFNTPLLLNTLKFNNSTTNTQITLYENSTTNLATNYTIFMESSRIRYNVNSGGAHYFSSGSGVSSYSNIAILSSAGMSLAGTIGLTLSGNRSVVMSGSGIINQSGTGINLMKNITQNVDCNLLQSGIGVIQQSGTTGTNAFKGSTFSGNNTHYNGSVITQYDTTNTNFTTLSQSGANYIISNSSSGGIIYLNSTEVNLTSSYATFKGATNINNYSSHFPYSDGVNYITGQTYFRLGSLETTDSYIHMRNEMGINFYDTEPVINQCSFFYAQGNLRFDNYADPLVVGSSRASFEFKTYNITTPFPRFHTRLNINYDGIQVKRGHLKIYNDDETSYLQADQISTTSTIKNTAVSGSMKLQTTNSSGVLVDNITMTATNTTIDNDLVCNGTTTYTGSTQFNVNITLPTSGFIVPTTDQLGYVNFQNISTVVLITMGSGTIYNYSNAMLFNQGTWIITFQLAFKCSTAGTITSQSFGISTSPISFDNKYTDRMTGGTAILNNYYTHTISRTISISSPTYYYALMSITFSSGVYQFGFTSGTDAYWNFSAVRIA